MPGKVARDLESLRTRTSRRARVMAELDAEDDSP